MARKREPKYALLEGHLRMQLRTGQLKTGQRLPSELTLAEAHAVSPGTVRRALAGLIQEGLLAPRRRSGVYVQVVPRQKLIGVMVPNVSNPDHSELVEALTRHAAARGYATSLLCRGNPDGTYRKGELLQHQFIDRMADWRAAGVVAAPTNPPIEAQLRTRMRQRNLPYVVVNDYWTDCRNDRHVQVDQDAAATLAVDYLVGLGHHRIAWWMDESDDWSGAAKAFLERLRVRGLPCGADQLVTGHGPAWMTKGVAAARKRTFTALVAPYYLRACLLLDTLQTAGIRVPDDVSLFCLGGLSAPVPPGVDFTATLNPIDRIAYRALAVLLEGNTEPVCDVRFKPVLHKGATTAPPPQAPDSHPVGEQQRKNVR